MAILKTKVELYLEDNSKTWASEKNNIILQNDSDGNGTYLVWKTDKVTKPTDTELANAKEAAVDADWWRVLRKTRDEKLVASDEDLRERVVSKFGDKYDILFRDQFYVPQYDEQSRVQNPHQDFKNLFNRPIGKSQEAREKQELDS